MESMRGRRYVHEAQLGPHPGRCSALRCSPHLRAVCLAWPHGKLHEREAEVSVRPGLVSQSIERERPAT